MGHINPSIIGIEVKVAYQVLARKWRPRNFQQMVGQEHVLQALSNALSHNRLHHAYLFTGTRGVGKTTIARIFAKSLNCETGVTATPCGQCAICRQIDNGNFVDLIEIDAASRTKVEDTRELLDSVQYVPHLGRYKVYVIDEVHMLSGHSFNALLKTLEEPPQHTKFLLATTDPQKIPVTVLSRCLQFHLKHLSAGQIAHHLSHILAEEKIIHESSALKQIAKAAHGSMRDALSLLDQAIAFSNHEITLAKTDALLGSIQTVYLYRLMDAICAKDSQQVFAAILEIAEHTSDFVQVLAELLLIFHQMAIVQLIADAPVDFADIEKLREWTKQLTTEEVQLFYQIALMGRRDLPLAPSPQTGFEMVLLRMLFFSPNENSVKAQPPVRPSLRTCAAGEAIQKMVSGLPRLANSASLAMTASRDGAELLQNSLAAPPFEPKQQIDPPFGNLMPNVDLKAPKDNSWAEVLAQINLTGITKTLASYCVLKEITDTHIYLLLDKSQAILLNEKQRERLEQALTNFYGIFRKLEISIGSSETLPPAVMQKEQEEKRQREVLKNIEHNSQVQNILQTFDAKLSSENVKILT